MKRLLVGASTLRQLMCVAAVTDRPIDVATVNSDAVFLVSLGSTTGPRERSRRVIGINQIVWDTFTNALYVESDELLAQHTRYALHHDQPTAGHRGATSTSK